MEPNTYAITYGTPNEKTVATQVRFSPACLFKCDGNPQEQSAMALINTHLENGRGGLGVCGRLFQAFSEHMPAINKADCLISEDEISGISGEFKGEIASFSDIPETVNRVFICEVKSLELDRLKKKIPQGIEILTPEMLPDLDPLAVPEHAWVPVYRSIYPIDIPSIDITPGLDMLLMDCPSRCLSFMPNGMAYVHKALEKEDIALQTIDLDIIVYHMFHYSRLMDTQGRHVRPDGVEMPEDPWSLAHMPLWSEPSFIEFFRPVITELVEQIGKAKPRILGLSISQMNATFSAEVVKGVRELSPDTVIMAGGYSCLHHEVGMHAFPQADYIVIGEADLTIGPLVQLMLKGGRPKDLPGVISRFDTPGRAFVPGALPTDLDSLDMPDYNFVDLDLYRNYTHYRLVPIVLNRGCRWGKCLFCGERFNWRCRSPKQFVDELEWLYDHGCDHIVVNDSDLNGDNDIVLEVCDEIIRRNLKLRLGGQLRVSHRNDRAFFDKLKEAGFIVLRFGVDGWSKNSLRLQNKGYAFKTIYQNLKDCHGAGIHIEVNSVIGVPGETEQDIDETIELMLQCKPFVWQMANLNPLVMIAGSVYWHHPEKYKIKFREDKDTLYRENPKFIPSHKWYSEEPYIDEPVRLARIKRILDALKASDYDFGSGAKPVMQRLDGEDLAVAQAADVQKTLVIRFEDVFLKLEGKAAMDMDSTKAVSMIRSVQMRNLSWGIDMVKKDVDGYNILKVLSDYCAVKHGYNYDLEKDLKGLYPPDVYLKAKTVKEVERMIEQQHIHRPKGEKRFA